MTNMHAKVMESVEYIKSKVNYVPKVCVILGSGLGDLVNVIEDKQYVDYKDIPNFPQVTVAGHAGRLVFGNIKGVSVVAMQGRFHFYEGYNMKEVTYPVFFMKLLGVEKLIVTNAAGGVNTDFEPGTLMLIKDFINLMGTNPLIGANDEKFGPRFPDMSEPYKINLMNKAKEVADKIGVEYKEGVYVALTGPYYETAAEIRMINTIGGDAVGMSTVPETIVANYLGLETLGISCITNMATGIQKHKHSHEKVVETAKKASENFCKWVEHIIAEM